MIFVTVGTHEQQFNRLITTIDKLVGDRIIVEEVIIQTGYSTYEPVNCKWSKLIPYEKMIDNIKKARIVITHGGPASFIMPLQIGKVPIVVPRQIEYDEHVNNHQLDFCKEVEKRNKNIILIDDINCLEEAIVNYDTIINSRLLELNSNNKEFNNKLKRIIDSMF